MELVRGRMNAAIRAPKSRSLAAYAGTRLQQFNDCGVEVRGGMSWKASAKRGFLRGRLIIG